MKVYLVWRECGFENDVIVGVFYTEALALKHIASIPKAGNTTHWEAMNKVDYSFWVQGREVIK